MDQNNMRGENEELNAAAPEEISEPDNTAEETVQQPQSSQSAPAAEDAAQTPDAVVYKATWPEQKIFRCTVGTLHDTVASNGLTKTSLIVVGGCLGDDYLRSLLYHPAFTTEFREATQ